MVFYKNDHGGGLVHRGDPIKIKPRRSLMVGIKAGGGPGTKVFTWGDPTAKS